MKTPLSLLVFSLAVASFAQQTEQEPSAASKRYNVYRHELTQPLYGVARVKAIVKTIKRNDEDNWPISAQKFKSLSLRERFAYTMLHGEDFAQNCDMMPQIMDEHKKIFSYFPNAFSDDMVWSEQQRNFLASNRTQVLGMVRETVRARNRIGVNLKQTIVQLRGVSLIPDAIAVYKRDRKDRDILTMLNLLMEDAKYAPWEKSAMRKKLYGDMNSYQAFLPLTRAYEDEILARAAAFYKSRAK